MGNNNSNPKQPADVTPKLETECKKSTTGESKKMKTTKKKICCACPETRKPRDEVRDHSFIHAITFLKYNYV